ncbi:GntR family transcriptional regulator [Mesorhizobium xinjiangense]|uniref:GntR family transcriptional regulator n=1 Tax=Mesorhizobium xinjiangense TaxID=2678685 RepID=UPI0018DC8E7B|nr:FCD domain-containing protein [Mesorhizobium xinjiangense]
MFSRGGEDNATVVRLLAEQVRRDISFGRLPPDTKLKIEELRQRYGGSAHSFREALTLLAADGLVEASAQRGFRVASATQADLEDITRLRVEIETLGLRWSMQNGDVQWEGAIIAANHALWRAEDKVAGDMDAFALEWDEAGRAFHANLIAACGSPRLIDTQARLYNQSRRFRLAALREGRIDFAASRQAHDAIVAAVLARDEEAAASALSDDILGSLKS